MTKYSGAGVSSILHSLLLLFFLAASNMKNYQVHSKEIRIMSESVVESISFGDFSLWGNLKGDKNIVSFDLELTARCNNDCRHCYINLPAGDKVAKKESER